MSVKLDHIGACELRVVLVSHLTLHMYYSLVIHSLSSFLYYVLVWLNGLSTHVVPVTSEIICGSGTMWIYLEFCTSCPVFVFKLLCMCDSIRFSPRRYSPSPLQVQHPK